MTRTDLEWERIWWVVAIPALLWATTIAAYVSVFSGKVSSDQAVWGQVGDYIGGIINPVISFVGLVAVVITLRANVAAIDENRRQLQAQLFAESESHFVELERMLASVPTALKFHNVAEDELANAGLTSQEFSYLMANFTAGGINVRALREDDVSVFEIGSYYRTMLESPHTRKAWPIIQRLMAPSPYKQRIESTILFINKHEAENANRQDA